MKRTIVQLTVFFMICSWLPLYSGIDLDNTPDPGYARFIDETFQYSILIPKEWHKTDYDLRYKHILILKKGPHPRIKVTATVIDEEETEKWQNWKDWYFADSSLMVIKIIEEKAFTRVKGLKGRLIVFEFKKGSQRYLERMLLAQFKNTQLIIECSAPVKSFYTYAGIFDAAMSSLKIH